MFFSFRQRALSTALLVVLSHISLFGETLQVDAEEFKRLVGEVADLRDANTSLQRRLQQLEFKADSLQNALREANDRSIEKFGSVATREDLGKLADSLRELDQKREADRKLILEQLEKLAASLSAPTEPVSAKHSKKSDLADQLASTKPLEGNFLTYVVQPGDMLEKVLKTYNQRLKEDSRPRVSAEQVLAANPGLNPNKLLVGTKILLPVPDKK